LNDRPPATDFTVFSNLKIKVMKKNSLKGLRDAGIHTLSPKQTKSLKGGGSGGGLTHDIIVWPM